MLVALADSVRGDREITAVEEKAQFVAALQGMVLALEGITHGFHLYRMDSPKL